MEQTGLTERRRDDRDSRVVRVSLTALGRSIRPRFCNAVETMNGLLVSGLGTKRATQIVRLLQRLMGTLYIEEERRRGTRKKFSQAAS